MNEKTEMIARIQYLIQKSSLKKSQILRDLQLSTSTLSDWEKGKGNPSSSAIMKLANYFNVSTDYILLGEKNSSDSTLSDDEYHCLELYNRMTEREKEICLAYMQGILDARAAHSKKGS